MAYYGGYGYNSGGSNGNSKMLAVIVIILGLALAPMFIGIPIAIWGFMMLGKS